MDGVYELPILKKHTRSNLKSATEKLFTTGIQCEIQEMNNFLKILYFV
jgi:hypothetical protein